MRAIKLKYRLSTVLLLVALVAVSLGWFVDHFNRGRQQIIGTWYYPTSDFSHMGYSTVLEIRPDKTFTKIQTGRTYRHVYDGTYTVGENGLVVFRVAKRTQIPHGPDSSNETNLDVVFACRCAIDPTGYLLIDDFGVVSIKKRTGIRWETYMPKNAK